MLLLQNESRMPALFMLKSSRRGLTLIEAIVILAIVGILIAVIIPAVVQSRESARQVECKNNLKQIGLAFHNYHETFAALPPGWIGVSAGKPDIYGINGFGWGIQIIPYIEANPIYGRTNFYCSIADPSNEEFRTGSPWSHPQNFLCPATTLETTWSITLTGREIVMPSGNYSAVFGTDGLDRCLSQPNRRCVGNGAFYHNSATAFRDIRDGIAQTCFVGERRTRSGGATPFHSTWAGVLPGDPLGLQRLLGTGEHAPGDREMSDADFGSSHAGGTGFVMGDGSVRFIDRDINLATFREMLTTGAVRNTATYLQSDD
jgi:type II secretory pathway pseudopilin PulG